MANYTRTIEYACAQNFAALAAATTYTFATRTLTIAETTSRTFASVHLVVTFDPNLTAATTNTTAPVITLQLGAATASSVSVPLDTTNGEDYRDSADGEYWLDVTSYFTTNFGAGTTQTAIVTGNWPVATKNHGAKFVITYNAASTNTTQTKTVKIPLEGSRGNVPTSLTSLGSVGAEVPNLSTFLPEASVTVTEICFDCWVTMQRPTTDPAISVALDAEAATTLIAANHGSMGTAGDLGKNRFLWQRLAISQTVTHDFKVATSVTASATNFCAVLIVTYTYNDSTTTTVLNSLMLPLEAHGSPLNTSTMGPVCLGTDFWIEEPATITYVQSAVYIQGGYHATPQSPTLDPLQVSTGSNAYVTYNSPETLGSFVDTWSKDNLSVLLRCDPSANGGASATLARGKNTILVSYRTSGTQNTSVVLFGGWYFLNYTSAKHASGTGVHARTVAFLIMGESSSSTTFNQQTYTFEPGASTQTIAEAAWTSVALGGLGLRLNTCTSLFTSIAAQYASGDSPLVGWIDFARFVFSTSGSVFRDILPAANFTKWWRGSWETLTTARANPFGVSRQWQLATYSFDNNRASLALWYTYHAITFTFAGTVTGYTGSGSGITVNIHRADTNELVTTCTTTTGGAYSATTYDSGIQHYAEARQDSNHLGRSDLAYPS